MHKPVIAVALILLATTPASAEQIEVKKERAHSINASPLGLISGRYNVNYEYLSGAHGLLGEVTAHRYSNDDADSSGVGGTVGYRWHWRGKQDSGFLGVNLGVWAGTGEGEVESNGTRKTFDVDTRAITLTGNVGRRWAWDSGFNITLRVGLGYGSYDITTDSTDPDAQLAVELVDDLLTLLPVAIDGELSLGYTF